MKHTIHVKNVQILSVLLDETSQSEHACEVSALINSRSSPALGSPLPSEVNLTPHQRVTAGPVSDSTDDFSGYHFKMYLQGHFKT